jgi:pimeloyl-ACP methyl ester carboxylesterase
MCPGGITPDKMSFLIRVIPLSLLGRWGSKRINRMLFGNQPVSEEVEEAIILITSNFKARFGVLPIFSDEELQRLTMPVLVLMGSQDVLRDGDKIIARMQKLVPHLSATIIPGAGHALLNTTGQIVPFLATGVQARPRFV